MGPRQWRRLLTTGNKKTTTGPKNKTKQKTYQFPILYPVEIFFRNEVEIKTFSGEGKLREFVTIRSSLKEMLKGVFQVEEKIVSEGKLETLGVKKE